MAATAEIYKDESLIGAKITYQPVDGKESWATNLYDHAFIGDLIPGTSFILTGYYYVVGGYTWLLTTSGYFVSAAISSGSVKNWQIYKNAAVVQDYSKTRAQYLVWKIIRNNKEILRNNLVCARYASKFTAEQQGKIKQLQQRLMARNSALLNEGLCESVETSYPEGYADLEPYLAAIMNNGSIGIASWAVIVIAAVVIGATATAAYFAYKQFADESEKDIKYSKELMAILAEKLTPEEYDQLLKETKGIVTKARIKQAAGSYAKVLRWALYAFAGVALYNILKPSEQ